MKGILYLSICKKGEDTKSETEGQERERKKELMFLVSSSKMSPVLR